jgi:hypothetical protein
MAWKKLRAGQGVVPGEGRWQMVNAPFNNYRKYYREYLLCTEKRSSVNEPVFFVEM